ncbi:hypothetical protein H0H93_004617 [Arthromyces matolae]|nr:hypothetical protein H0H93_004617 [Arthromyces matolae]
MRAIFLDLQAVKYRRWQPQRMNKVSPFFSVLTSRVIALYKVPTVTSLFSPPFEDSILVGVVSHLWSIMATLRRAPQATAHLAEPNVPLPEQEPRLSHTQPERVINEHYRHDRYPNEHTAHSHSQLDTHTPEDDFTNFNDNIQLSPLTYNSTSEPISSPSSIASSSGNVLGLSFDVRTRAVTRRPTPYGTVALPSVSDIASPASLLPAAPPTSPAVAFSFIEPLPPINESPSTHVTHSLGLAHPFHAPPAESLRSNSWRFLEDLRTVRNLKLDTPINVTNFLQLILDCPLLEKLAIKLGADGLSPPPVFPTSVCTANLIDLSIITSVSTKPLFDAFKAPNLAMLHVEWDSRNNADPPTNLGLLHFLSTSQCSLNTLSLVDMSPDESHLISCLSLNCLSHLQSLVVRSQNYRPSDVEFTGRVIGEATLDALSQVDTRNLPLCPHLVRLELVPCSAADGKLAAMVEARGNVATPQPAFSLLYSANTESRNSRDRSKLLELVHRQPYWKIVEEGCMIVYP